MSYSGVMGGDGCVLGQGRGGSPGIFRADGTRGTGEVIQDTFHGTVGVG